MTSAIATAPRTARERAAVNSHAAAAGITNGQQGRRKRRYPGPLAASYARYGNALLKTKSATPTDAWRSSERQRPAAATATAAKPTIASGECQTTSIVRYRWRFGSTFDR